MKPAIALACAAAALCACVSTKVAELKDSDRHAWRGKTVAVTSRPRAGFVAYTPGKAAFGIIGALAEGEAGADIVQQNGIEDPAPRVAQDLLAIAQQKFSVVAAAGSPVAVDTRDVAALARSASNADLLIDVQGLSQDFRYRSLDWVHYIVDSKMTVRLIDVRHATLIAEESCDQSSDEDKKPTRAELLENNAARLKDTLEAQRLECVKEFEQAVFGS